MCIHEFTATVLTMLHSNIKAGFIRVAMNIAARRPREKVP